jgi:phosphatidylinositol glycan class A protein
MVSDFFYPKVGGVESHIYMLSQALIRLGHKVRHTYLELMHPTLANFVHQVVIVTHRYTPDRVGVRYLTSGLKVYYIPIHTIPPHSGHASLPQFFASLPLLRCILIREQIDVIHGHGSLSSMACEAIIGGGTMGVPSVLTDHSLFGLGGKGEMWGNKMLQAVLADIGAVICVSHTG